MISSLDFDDLVDVFSIWDRPDDVPAYQYAKEFLVLLASVQENKHVTGLHDRIKDELKGQQKAQSNFTFNMNKETGAADFLKQLRKMTGLL